MNTLTQQQINQYQWQAADGVARIHNGPVFSVDWNNKEHDLSNIEYFTNAPDGIYSGEAFEEPVWQYKPYGGKDYIVTDNPFLVDEMRRNGVPVNPFLRLKPLHLPAVLTTQPGEEWKDRYKPCIISITQKDAETTVGYDYVIPYLNCGGWRVEYRLITPPAEQEAETVEQVLQRTIRANTNYPNYQECCHWNNGPNIDVILSAMEEYSKQAICQLQSTLTQKDQRIAELEREMEWISVAIKEPELDSTIMIAYLFMGRVSIINYDSRDLLQYFKYWIPLPSPPQH